MSEKKEKIDSEEEWERIDKPEEAEVEAMLVEEAHFSQILWLTAQSINFFFFPFSFAPLFLGTQVYKLEKSEVSRTMTQELEIRNENKA